MNNDVLGYCTKTLFYIIQNTIFLQIFVFLNLFLSRDVSAGHDIYIEFFSRKQLQINKHNIVTVIKLIRNLTFCVN